MSDNPKVSGGCLCGTVRFEIDRTGIISAHHCHCTDCQKSTGSGKATIVMMPEAAFRLLQGEAKFYTVQGTSGATVSRGFCDQCGSPLYSRIDSFPTLTMVKAGSLDDSSWVKPKSSFWSDSAAPWSPCDPTIEAHIGNPGR